MVRRWERRKRIRVRRWRRRNEAGEREEGK